jgi:MFS family permease
LWLLPANQLWQFYLFAIIFASGYGSSSALQSPIIAEYFGLKSHGAIMGMLMAVNFAGGAAGPALAGYIFDISVDYRWAFMICIIISVIAFSATFLLKSSRKS